MTTDPYYPQLPGHSLLTILHKGLPTCLRERYARCKLIEAARIIDVLYFHAFEIGLFFSEEQLRRLIARYGLKREYINMMKTCGWLNQFSDADISRFAETTPLDLRPRSPLSRRFHLDVKKGDVRRIYTMPNALLLCEQIGQADCLSSDPLQAGDLSSSLTYRLALHREFLRRAPGYYSREFLGDRIGMKPHILQGFEPCRHIQVTPRPAQEIAITLDNVHQLSNVMPQRPSVWLLDEQGNRYLPLYACAVQLLDEGRQLTLVEPMINHYSLL